MGVDIVHSSHLEHNLIQSRLDLQEKLPWQSKVWCKMWTTLIELRTQQSNSQTLWYLLSPNSCWYTPIVSKSLTVYATTVLNLMLSNPTACSVTAPAKPQKGKLPWSFGLSAAAPLVSRCNLVLRLSPKGNCQFHHLQIKFFEVVNMGSSHQ